MNFLQEKIKKAINTANKKKIKKAINTANKKNYQINMRYLYFKYHMENFVKKSVEDKALLFDDYERYVESNLAYFKNYVKKNSLSVDRCVFLELGVFKGYSINFMSSRCKNYAFYGFDSFDGFSNVSKDSVWKNYDEMFKNIPVPEVNENVELIGGFIENTFDAFCEKNADKHDTFFLHLDADVYEPTIVALNFVKENYKKKKFFLMFDELINYEEFHLHEYRAFLETIIRNNIRFKIINMCDRALNKFGMLGKVFLEISD